MRGFPKHLNTKQDYLNTLQTMPEETKADLRQLMEARLTWQPVKALKDSENPKETAIKKILERTVPGDDGAEQTERWQYELKEDPNAWFNVLGFTVEEAETLLNK